MAKRSQNPMVDKRYDDWKHCIPLLYDWFTNHNLVWPSLSCRWGPQTEQDKFKHNQQLYISERTDGSVPNTLIIANVEVVKKRVAAAEHIEKFDEESRSAFINKRKTIIHPGEVNCIRELPQNGDIVATHADSRLVFIWNVKTQLNRQAFVGANASTPDLKLAGHDDTAEFALATCHTEPYVLSGGTDKLVVWWDIGDDISTLLENRGPPYNHILSPRGRFKGHEDTVEDVQFNPSSPKEFCSVGDDSCLILWDARTSTTPTVKVRKAHNADIHSVDWNCYNDNLILTGSADNTIRMYDRRKLISRGIGSPVHTFVGHTAPVVRVQWSPHKKSVFGSSAEDGFLNVWDLKKMGEATGSPPGLMFHHAGHRDKVVDFHWNPIDPWTIASVSDETEKIGGGGTIQVWRIMDLIYRDKKEVKAELNKHKDHILECVSRDFSKVHLEDS